MMKWNKNAASQKGRVFRSGLLSTAMLAAVLVLAVLFLLYGCAVQRLIYSSRGTMIFLPERPLL